MVSRPFWVAGLNHPQIRRQPRKSDYLVLLLYIRASQSVDCTRKGRRILFRMLLLCRVRLLSLLQPLLMHCKRNIYLFEVIRSPLLP